MSHLSSSQRSHKKLLHKNLLRPQVETLEDRSLMSCTSISGFVYYDANNNGLFDTGETPIANSQIELRDANNVVIGTTTTDNAGHYTFDTDMAHPGAESTLTKTVTFNNLQMDFNANGLLTQFDPTLGELESIDIQHSGSVTSDIRVENVSVDSESSITATVSGKLHLVAPGVDDQLTIADNVGTFHALKYDGNTDFAGTSGKHFVDANGNSPTATGSNPIITLHKGDNHFNDYIGTGNVSVQEAGMATSNAVGGGNLDTKIRSSGSSTVTVTYHYKATSCIAPGNYKIIQTKQPDGYTDGQESKDGVVIPNSIGTDFIPVTLTANADLVNNNFGELKPNQISGHVWYDANNDGIRQSTEQLIAGTTITLMTPTGSLQTTTDANGYYHFDNLAPGTYTIKETQPANYLDGKDNAGTINGIVTGTVVNDPAMDQIQNITLLAGQNSINNDFGEIKTASLSGHVYYDANNDGIHQNNETWIAGTTITLMTPTGSLQTTTDANGYYHFDNLAPGSYTIKETQPANYLDGKDSAGTINGVVTGTVVNDPAMDQIQNVTLQTGDSSINNDFGEIKPASLAGHVYYDANNNGKFDSNEQPIPGTTVTLTGFDDQGPVNLTTTTNAKGEYSFTQLRPGSYAITETQPVGYNDGKDTIGTPGGTTGNDVFSDIHLNAGVDGVNNDFGEVKPDTPDNPLPKDVVPFGMIPIISKSQLLSSSSLDYIDPAVRGQMAFVVGIRSTATGQSPDYQTVMQDFANLRSGMTNGAFVNSVWNSSAQRSAQVNNLYQSILQRTPTAQEQSSVVAQLQSGTDVLTIKENLYVTSEFQQLHPTAEGFATALSQGILNVTPGTASTQTLLQSMDAEPLNTVVHNLLISNASLANQIDDAFHLTLRRAATSAEIQTWTTQLQSGAITLDGLTQRLLSSQEFYQLAYNSVH